MWVICTVEWRLKSHISPQYPSSDNVVKVLPWTPKKSLKKKEFVSIVFLNCCEKKSDKIVFINYCCKKKVKIGSYLSNCAVNQWKCCSTKTMWTRKFFKRLNRWRIFELINKKPRKNQKKDKMLKWVVFAKPQEFRKRVVVRSPIYFIF